MKYKKGYKYKLVETTQYVFQERIKIKHTITPFITISGTIIEIKSGYAWDGPSGPTSDTKSFMRGSLIHDALYQLIREGYLNISYRDWADRELRAICLEYGMNPIRAFWVYWAVRLFGKPAATIRKRVYET